MSGYSSNVILAKTRAMYGSCLKKQNYADLLACHRVGEIAAYLKQNTAYAAVLQDINETTIHRRHLEALLKRKLFLDYASLSRYDLTVGTHLSDYLIQQGEITQIEQCLRLMSVGRTNEFYLSMPLFFTGHSKLDYLKMSRSKNYEELLEALSGTPYHKILELYRPDESGRIRLTEIENALYNRLVETLYAIIDETKGELHKQLISLCGSQVEAQNVSRIIRMKTYFHASPDTIRANLLPWGRSIPRRLIDGMLEADSAEEVLRIYYGTTAGRQIPEDQRPFVHDLYHRAPYFNARHYIHFSSYAMVVMISYVIITEVEVDDITNIIEGVRYGLTPEEIKPMLVLVEH